MKGTGRRTSGTGRGTSDSQMGIFTSGPMSMGSRTGKGFTHGRMGRSMMGNGKMD